MDSIHHSKVCKFNKTSKTLEKLFPPDSKFRKLRRKFRESLLVSEKNGRRCFMPKGTAGYIFEKEKQLTQHYYKIHPYSKFREIWEIIAVVEMVVSPSVRFFAGAYCRPVTLSLGYQIPAFLGDMFEMSDVFLGFLTGYMDKGSGNVALETRKIFYHNVRQLSFYPTLISSVPFEFMAFLATEIKSTEEACLFVNLLKIFKLIAISKYLRHIAKIHNWGQVAHAAVWTSLAMFFIIHWLSCTFYMVIYGEMFGEPDNSFPPDTGALFHYCNILYMISSIYFFHQGLLSQVNANCIKDILFCLFVLVITQLTNIVFVGLFIQLLGLRKTSFIYYEEMIQETRKFLIQENLPEHIHKKVIKYLEFHFQHRFFQEKIILETLSPPLRREIARFFCMDLLLKSDSIFSGIPHQLASDLCLEMKLEVFMPGDHIVKAGRRAKKVFFIYCGTVAAYTPRGKEVYHVYEGGQLGVSTFSVNSRYQLTVVALEMTECYMLSYHSFLKLAAEYPECMNDIAERVNAIREFRKTQYLGS